MHINKQHNYHKKVYIETPKIFYYDTHKIIKNIYIYIFFLVYIKIDRQNIMFFKNDDELYTMVDLYLNHRFLGYEDSYNHYDITL